MKPGGSGESVLATNRKALFNYEVLERAEAGVSLVGTEVKSIREGGLNFRDAFVEVETTGEVALGMTVADLRERRDPSAPNCAFAEAVDADAARGRILERLLA